ncbi:antistasin-like isoform X2 [Hydra vulgaris]|uniref:antistasin-like isoform X2 n=1 Tax=Hydra vulgaris TaxID=6087 RepID=UPI0032EA09F5
MNHLIVVLALSAVVTFANAECDKKQCRMFCKFGFQQDENGCDICKCAERPEKRCNNRQCKMLCPEGFQVDANGCEICRCKRSALEAPEKKCDGLKQCKMHCENGFVRDENGCPKCECSKCKQFQCLIFCPHGNEVDENGCKTCKCKAAPEKKKCNKIIIIDWLNNFFFSYCYLDAPRRPYGSCYRAPWKCI